jgi:hypothetical protein
MANTTDRLLALAGGVFGGIIATPILIALGRRAERAAQRRAGMWTA